MKKIISWALVLVGAFFAFLPHSVHVSVGASYVEHMYHVIFGVICLVIGGGMLWKSKMPMM
ncbi:MAG: hypothetical protein V4674_02795 [Patescibacteria group bacterium]